MSTARKAADRPRMALPAWVYNHPEMTRLEIERVLRPSWQIACHVCSVPAAGDYVAFDLGDDSVLVLRDRDGAVFLGNVPPDEGDDVVRKFQIGQMDDFRPKMGGLGLGDVRRP